MKNRILAILIAALLLIPASLKAQKNTNDAIAKIRQDYSTALERIKVVGDYYDNEYVNCATVNIKEMWAGSGPHAEKTEVFYTMGLDEEWSFDRTVLLLQGGWV